MNQTVPDSALLSRRSMLRSGILALFGAHSLGLSLTRAASHPVTSHLSAAVDPMTVLILAKTTLDLVQGFSKKRDGLGAMLQYQIAMLGEISKQLGSIQSKLVELENLIISLPEDTRLALRLQFRSELLHTIAGAAEVYRSEVLEPSREDPGILSNARVQDKIRTTHQTVSQSRATLMQLPEGVGPHACLTAPVALALEVACAAQLEDPPPTIIGKLNSYDRWLTNMLGQQTGSIPSIQQAAATEHDRQIATLDKNPLAQRLNVGRFLIVTCPHQSSPV